MIVSPLSPSSRGPFRKPRADIYTVMLVLALVAIVVGCVFMYLEVADYGPQPYQLGLAVPRDLARPAAVAGRWPSPLCRPGSTDCLKTPVHG
jgi:hypothetical protein